MFELFSEEEGVGRVIELRPTLSRGGLGRDTLSVPKIGFDLVVDTHLGFGFDFELELSEFFRLTDSENLCLEDVGSLIYR